MGLHDQILVIFQNLLQLFFVDLLDIGLMNASDAVGRKRLNESLAQFVDAIARGFVGTAAGFEFGVMSLRECYDGGVNNTCDDVADIVMSPPLNFTAAL